MIQLRQIRESDFPRVNEICSEAFGTSPSPPIEYVANLCHTEPEGCLVGTVAGEIVGYACSHRSGRVGYIGNLAVVATHRGKGYGKALTAAVRDHLVARCDIVGLAVEPDNGRNLGLYASCGFEPTLPSCFVGLRLSPDRPTAAASIRTARQLGAEASTAIQQIRSWTDEILPGLDFTRDLDHFAQVYPERLLIAYVDDAPRGFLAYHDLFRGDPWCAVRPGPNDSDMLNTLVEAVEASESGDVMTFHFHTNFRRILQVLRNRGYEVLGHKTCMVLQGQAGVWPPASDSLFIRPWWS